MNNISPDELLTPSAKLADRVWWHIIFSGRFDNVKPSDLKARFIIPIFGEKVSKELTDYYLGAEV